MCLLVLFCFVGLVVSLSAPVMPSQFVATFTNPIAPLQPYTGTWYYDYTRRIQRVDGGNQESCNRNSNTGEYCTTYLDSKFFYVAFPFKQYCCVDSAPGLLRPDWLAHDNATFVGVQRVGTRSCDVWLAMGSAHNYYLAERKTGFLCLLDDGGFNWTFSSFQATSFDQSITNIPPYCVNAPQCPPAGKK